MFNKKTRKKYLTILMLLIILLITSGCVKGEVTLDLKYNGGAELNCRLLAPPFIKSQLAQLEQEFRSDGFAVAEVRDTGLEGFTASRSFARVDEIKNIKLFTSFNAKKIAAESKTNLSESNQVPASQPEIAPTPAAEAPKTKVITTNNLFTTTYDIDANIDLRLGNKNYAEDDKWLMRTLLSQVGLKFILKTPVAIDKSNAHEVSADGKTLTWNLILGTENQVAATATIINPTRVGILLGIIVVIAIIVYVKFFRSKRA